ncbi:1-deoxy-D-xylulose-5-phosphate reductoisomerase [Varunaivibrio sulfuroxidans]|uniref:1-deoxy-D-xylulose 5-phosphate reductoisomerase n=1 Tax=Varunaivibrio sulfuroxidans TaxID=1773489 RepID=A0A4R3JDM9_9PROT|nr:1-deoxy-D-xylulose-5-phosphate reductoisomerase [Varunaivibrio sulfuroxidans]TCS64159.1 1-deoxy-D-xylulose 5-phosphate reductoisomerase [Varunaivibrio sulfuroxidans]WES31395.1 1-deoxy-D-xylulose-5-phosphate reductoisomerase [Varunaivibrio sulfuroxidans]
MAIAQSQPAVLRHPQSVTILGATGSVGCNTVDVVERNPEKFTVTALCAKRNVSLLADQARRLRPELCVVADESMFAALKTALAGTGIEVAAGAQAVIDAARLPSDIVVAAIVGTAGLRPTLAAARRGAVVALANKECLVSAGELMMAEVRAHGATLLPVDSEHSAIFQVFDFDRVDGVEKVTLTASGGPFRTWDIARMAAVTPEQACAHPNWDMGAKISIDSATMMNKGLELIEAYHLFPVGHQRLETLVHPQSVIHSMVSYVDGSVLAQLGAPDMRTPIAYALSWPQRMHAPSARLSLSEIGQLTFEAPDIARFPALRLAGESLRFGGGAPTVLNGANEVAVTAFLERKIGFLDIAGIVEQTLQLLPGAPVDSLENVMALDGEARRVARLEVDRVAAARP